MEFVLDPPHGVGPLQLGMTVDEARSALSTLGPLDSTAHGELALHLPSGLGFSAGFGVGTTRDLVNAIELWRPTGTEVVLYRDVDVFGLPAREVVERLRRLVYLKPNEDDDGFNAREVHLALWRPFAADDDLTRTNAISFSQFSWPDPPTTTRPPRPLRGSLLADNRDTDPR